MRHIIKLYITTIQRYCIIFKVVWYYNTTFCKNKMIVSTYYINLLMINYYCIMIDFDYFQMSYGIYAPIEFKYFSNEMLLTTRSTIQN